MSNRILDILLAGWRTATSNRALSLVIVLVFVFPLLLIWVVQSFFTLSNLNVDSVERLREGMLNDTLSGLLVAQADQEVIQRTIDTIVQNNVGDKIKLTDIRIYRPTAEGLLIINGADQSLLGTVDPTMTQRIRSVSFSDTNDYWAFNYQLGNSSIRQIFKRVSVDDNFFFIVSEFDRTLFERTLLQRQFESYMVLSVIFAFLIALAYWLRKQTDWQILFQEAQGHLTERDNFSNMIAHELRSPLTAIRGYASLLTESSALSPENARFAKNIEVSAERLVVLVSDFLEVARLHSGKMKVEIQSIDISPIISQVITDLTVLANKKGLKLEYEQIGRRFTVETDPLRLGQVLTNLVSNAIKYSDQGTVKISAEETRTGLSIRVKDSGMGISAEDQQKLFAPFTRVGGVDGKPITGSGLGMWITKQIVDILKGKIGVESIKGVGTHVVLVLPYELRQSK